MGALREAPSGRPGLRLRILAVGDGGYRVVEPLRADPLLASTGQVEARVVALGVSQLALAGSDPEGLVQIRRLRTGAGSLLRDEVRWRDDLDHELRRADLCLLAVDASDAESLEVASVAGRIGRERGCLSLAFVVGRPPDDPSAGVLPLVEDDLAPVVRAADSAFVVPTFGASPAQADALVGRTILALLQISRQPGLLDYSLREIRETFRRAGAGEVAAGRGEGTTRFSDAAAAVLASPTLYYPLRDATGVALHVRAPASTTLFDLNELSAAVAAACDPGANVWTAVYLDSPEPDAVEVTLVASGFPLT